LIRAAKHAELEDQRPSTRSMKRMRPQPRTALRWFAENYG